MGYVCYPLWLAHAKFSRGFGTFSDLSPSLLFNKVTLNIIVIGCQEWSMENFMCGLLALLGQSGGGGCGALPHFREKPQKTIE